MGINHLFKAVIRKILTLLQYLHCTTLGEVEQAKQKQFSSQPFLMYHPVPTPSRPRQQMAQKQDTSEDKGKQDKVQEKFISVRFIMLIAKLTSQQSNC